MSETTVALSKIDAAITAALGAHAVLNVLSANLLDCRRDEPLELSSEAADALRFAISVAIDSVSEIDRMHREALKRTAT